MRAAKAARAVAAAGAGLALGLAPAVPAQAAPAETTTTTFHRATETFTAVVPCVGDGPAAPPATITVIYNGVLHETTKGAGEHFTITQTGTFRAVYEDRRLGTSTGRFTIWGGVNSKDGVTGVGTFTFSGTIRTGTGAGTRWNSVDHFRGALDGSMEPEQAFSRFRCH